MDPILVRQSLRNPVGGFLSLIISAAQADASDPSLITAAVDPCMTIWLVQRISDFQSKPPIPAIPRWKSNESTRHGNAVGAPSDTLNNSGVEITPSPLDASCTSVSAWLRIHKKIDIWLGPLSHDHYHSNIASLNAVASSSIQDEQ